MLNPFSRFAAVRQYNFAKRLAKDNHVTLCLPKRDKYSGYENCKVEDIPGLKVVHPVQLPFKNIEIGMSTYIPTAFIMLMRGDYDIVHGFRPLPFSAMIGQMIAKKKGIPFVLEMGDIESETMDKLDCHPNYRKKIVANMEANLIRKADMITCMNKEVKKYIIDNFNIESSKIEIISNGVDTELFSPEKGHKSEIFGSKQFRKMMYVGKLDNIEHIKDFVSRFKELGPNYHLTIVGDGDKRKELEAMATGDVLFVGRVKQDLLPMLMNTTDILIAPFSRTKGVEYASNLKLFEYMSMNKPVVISDVGNKVDELGGLVYSYEPGNMKQLKTVLGNIDYNSDVKSREYIKRHFDWNVLTKKLNNVYTKVLKRYKNKTK